MNAPASIYPIRLSYSSLGTLLSCERKFQLNRLLLNSIERESSPAMNFGAAVGEGIADYFVHQDINKAMHVVWLKWDANPEYSDKTRFEESAIACIMAMQPRMDEILGDWEVAYFEGKPAVELSFRINIDEKFYYVGYVDLILRNKFSGKYAVLENKTTSSNLLNLAPMYQNSGQALGYSIVLDAVAGEEAADYGLMYLVAQLGREPFSFTAQMYNFDKTLRDRLAWFIALGMDVNHLRSMLELDIFPMRGHACVSYNRTCPHFGSCHMRSLDIYKAAEVDEEEYQFVFDLNALVADHIRRV